MTLPSTKMLYRLLTISYTVGLCFTYIFGENGALLVWMPIGLTAVLIAAQVQVMKREQAAAAAGHGSGTQLSHAWAVVLLIYLIVVTLHVGLSNGIPVGNVPAG